MRQFCARVRWWIVRVAQPSRTADHDNTETAETSRRRVAAGSSEWYSRDDVKRYFHQLELAVQPYMVLRDVTLSVRYAPLFPQVEKRD